MCNNFWGVILQTVGTFALHKRTFSDLWHNPKPHLDLFKQRDSTCSVPVHTLINEIRYQQSGHFFE
jgi:hypothetical protein